MMVIISLSEQYPLFPFGAANEKIEMLLLNKSQLHAVNDAQTKKIIEGKVFFK